MSYEEWIELADEYYLAARSLQWFSGLNYPTTHAGHHALELYLKAKGVKINGQYNDREHDLRNLYAALIELEPSMKSAIVEVAIDKYWNYDQVARYTSKAANPKKVPINNGMGSDSVRALDSAVAILRDLNVTTRRGLDRLIAGESDHTVNGFTDPYLSLQSVILFHFNDAFKPQTPEIMNNVRYSAPQWKV